jgi:hypothetical protein
MDDIKLYAFKKNHILSLLTITENFSNDIGMSFGIDKCNMQSICRGHYEHLEYTGCLTKTFEPNNSVIFQRIFVKFKMQIF